MKPSPFLKHTRFSPSELGTDKKEVVMAFLLILGVLILIAGVISTLATLRYLLSGDYEVDQRIQKILRS